MATNVQNNGYNMELEKARGDTEAGSSFSNIMRNLMEMMDPINILGKLLEMVMGLLKMLTSA